MTKDLTKTKAGKRGNVSEQVWKNPKWRSGGRIHNWHNHVPDGVRTIWDSFNDNQKFALYHWAENLASAEEWE